MSQTITTPLHSKNILFTDVFEERPESIDLRSVELLAPHKLLEVRFEEWGPGEATSLLTHHSFDLRPRRFDVLNFDTSHRINEVPAVVHYSVLVVEPWHLI